MHRLYLCNKLINGVVMKEALISVVLIIFFTGSSIATQLSGAQTQSISGINYDNSSSPSSTPGTWVKVGSLTNIATYSKIDSYSSCISSPLCAWTILTIGLSGVSWTRPSIYFFSPNVTLSGSDDASQYTFQFALCASRNVSAFTTLN